MMTVLGFKGHRVDNKCILGRLQRVDLITGVRCPSVRPQKVFPIPMKFGVQVERGR